jgi:hypothetical protein
MTDPAAVMDRIRDARWIDENIRVDDQALSSAHRQRKILLFEEAKRRLQYRRQRSEWAQGEMELRGDRQAAHYFSEEQAAARRDEAFLQEFDPDVLTIGFGRRFIEYKRAALIFHDMERLKSIVAKSGKPLQIIMTGKAHKKDNVSQDIIRRVQAAATELRLSGLPIKVILIENYDPELARVLESGTDIWLNNPRRGEEASGTSGMKAAMNGVLNMGARDGWDPEGIIDQSDNEDGVVNGWLFGVAEDEQSDSVDAEELYGVLEDAIRDFNDKPTWMRRMKAAIVSGVVKFGTGRMLNQNLDTLYVPATENTITEEQAIQKAREKQIRREEIVHAMRAGAARDVQILGYPPVVTSGESFAISAIVDLKSLTPDDIGVDLFMGPDKRPWRWRAMEAIPLGDGRYKFTAQVHLPPGQFKFKIRVTPKDQTLWRSHEELLQHTHYSAEGSYPIQSEDQDLLQYRVNRREARFFSLEIPPAKGNAVKRVLWGSAQTGWWENPVEMQPSGSHFWTGWVDRQRFRHAQGLYQFKFRVEYEDGQIQYQTGSYLSPKLADNPDQNAVIDLSQNDGSDVADEDHERSRLFTMSLPFSISAYKQRLIEGVYWISDDNHQGAAHWGQGEPRERYRMDEIKPGTWAFLPPARFFKNEHQGPYQFKFIVRFKDGREKFLSGSYPIDISNFDNAIVSLSDHLAYPSADIAEWELQRLRATRTDQALRWIFDHPNMLDIWLNRGMPTLSAEQMAERFAPQELELIMTAMAVMAPDQSQFFRSWEPLIADHLSRSTNLRELLAQRLKAYSEETPGQGIGYQIQDLSEWKRANFEDYQSFFPAFHQAMVSQTSAAAGALAIWKRWKFSKNWSRTTIGLVEGLVSLLGSGTVLELIKLAGPQLAKLLHLPLDLQQGIFIAVAAAILGGSYHGLIYLHMKYGVVQADGTVLQNHAPTAYTAGRIAFSSFLVGIPLITWGLFTASIPILTVGLVLGVLVHTFLNWLADYDPNWTWVG